MCAFAVDDVVPANVAVEDVMVMEPDDCGQDI